MTLVVNNFNGHVVAQRNLPSTQVLGIFVIHSTSITSKTLVDVYNHLNLSICKPIAVDRCLAILKLLSSDTIIHKTVTYDMAIPYRWSRI